MRESEEYLEEAKYIAEELDGFIPVILQIDAEHAVKLAYKEGLLKAIDKIQEISLKVFGDYVPGDVLEFLVEIHKLKKDANK